MLGSHDKCFSYHALHHKRMHPLTSSLGHTSAEKAVEGQCSPPVLLIKKLRQTPALGETGECLKTIRFGVLGRDAVSFEGQVMIVHT